MRKNLKWLVVTGVAVILAIAIAVPVAAAGPNGAGGNGGQGAGGVAESVTGLLGLTPEQIQEQRQAGKSLVEIAEAQGVSQEALVEALLKDRQVTLQEMVEAGTITQLQADQRLAQMKERIELAVNRTTTGAPEWAGNGVQGQNSGKKGMKRQGGFGNNSADCTGTPGSCTGAGKMNRFGSNTD